MTQTDTNPYLPPGRLSVQDFTPNAVSHPAWVKWLIGAVVLESLATFSMIILDKGGIVSGDGGDTCAIVSGTGLFLACILVGLRYDRKRALLIGQLLNAVVWPTMLLTALVSLPFVFGYSFNPGAYHYFVNAALWGSAGAAVVVWIVGLLRRSKPDMAE